MCMELTGLENSNTHTTSGMESLNPANEKTHVFFLQKNRLLKVLNILLTFVDSSGSLSNLYLTYKTNKFLTI